MKFGPFEIRFGKKAPQPARQPRRGKRVYFDSANTTDYMGNHWKAADGRDANSPLLDEVSIIRNRCRFEIANNPLAVAAATALADAVIGSGPMLQTLTENKAVNESIEKRFREWSRVCDFRGIESFGHILRMVGAFNQVDSGEGFIILKTSNDKKNPVSLRLLVVESDRIADPWGAWSDKTIDGIKVNDEGVPEAYYLLKFHPGSDKAFAAKTDYDVIPAGQVIHLFRPLRPGQNRGLPWLSPSLQTFAEMRSFSKSVIEAADIAARLAGVLETDSALLPGSTTDYESFDPVEIEKGSMMTLPKGLRLNPFKPEQPVTSYSEFQETKQKEAGRAFNMPFNVIAGDSSKYNYASGRLDYQNWWKFVGVIQDWIEYAACDRIFDRWLMEAALIDGYIELGGLGIDEILQADHSWIWPGTEHVDPSKEAQAQESNLRNLTTTLSDEWAKKGQDWEKKVRQIQRERNLLDELGLKIEQAAPAKDTDNENENKADQDQNDDDAGGKSKSDDDDGKQPGRFRVA